MVDLAARQRLAQLGRAPGADAGAGQVGRGKGFRRLEGWPVSGDAGRARRRTVARPGQPVGATGALPPRGVIQVIHLIRYRLSVPCRLPPTAIASPAYSSTRLNRWPTRSTARGARHDDVLE